MVLTNYTLISVTKLDCIDVAITVKRNWNLNLATNLKIRVWCFHFGEYDKETKMSTGKDVDSFNPIVTKGEHPMKYMRVNMITHDFFNI